ncbi:uncharacterized protein K489DRAFT_229126 [Dissoconium aciculare CBS 342.82]|uniref:Uncharacterized protein n=1 Tax=Dissoconium aciculare CBS 342.82 TaxID=1314786 RepID=A0A6J3M1R1_9PEZI|nr:uncharacterized protein K489DRAFT_229126 [Dissoconium aciculare CBS 342.82]KAF1821951.1 hypothetical protein K489DRAFT_229126 [Dissoconium aciculare CBS 342.82]
MKEVRAIPGPGPGWIGQGSRARQASPRRRIHRHTGEDREGDVLESILSFGCRTDRRLPSRRATSPFDRRALLFASFHITSAIHRLHADPRPSCDILQQGKRTSSDQGRRSHSRCLLLLLATPEMPAA